MNKRKCMSPKLYHEALRNTDPQFIGETILRLLEWQIQKGQKTFYNLGWYLRLVWREWQKEDQRRRQKEDSYIPRTGLNPIKTGSGYEQYIQG